MLVLLFISLFVIITAYIKLDGDNDFLKITFEIYKE